MRQSLASTLRGQSSGEAVTEDFGDTTGGFPSGLGSSGAVL